MTASLRLRRLRALGSFVVILSILCYVLLWQNPSLGERSVGLLPSAYRASVGDFADDQAQSVGAANAAEGTQIGRVLITGGGGNIGKALIRDLLQRRVPIIAYDLVFDEAELEQIHADLPQADKLLRVVRADIRDIVELSSTLRDGVDGVINLAAVSRVLWCLENQDDCEDVNVRAVDTLLSQMAKLPRIPWLVQASSREVYGNAVSFPVTEDDPTEPANAYGASKLRAEQVIQRHISDGKSRSGEGGAIRAIALRLSNVYGSTADHGARLIPALVTQAIAHRPIHLVGGKQDLDMVHIEDVTAAFVRAAGYLSRKRSLFGKLFSTANNFEAINVCAGRTAQALTLVRKIITLTESNSPVQIIPGDDRFPDYYIGSGDKAERLLGHSANIQVDEGLLRLVTAYQQENMRHLRSHRADNCNTELNLHDDSIDELDRCSGYITLEHKGAARFLQFNWEHNWNFGWYVENKPEPVMLDFRITKLAAGSPFARIISMNVSWPEHTINMTFPPDKIGPAYEFGLDFDITTGFIRLRVNETDALKVLNKGWDEYLGAGPVEGFNARIVPVCCPNRKGPWPLYLEDPLVGMIDDLKYAGTDYPFDTRHRHLKCGYLDSALAVLEGKLDRLHTRTETTDKGDLSSRIEMAELPDGEAKDWAHYELPVCLNLCSLPTICLDTGGCSCAQDACPPISRFPFQNVANLPLLSYPPPPITEPTIDDTNQLVDSVASASWINVLRPHVARYLSKQPAFPKIHITKLPDDIQEDRDTNPSKYDQLKSSTTGCFSADGALERGLQLMQSEYSPEAMVFMPYYAGTIHDMKFVNDWANNALQYHLPADFDQSRLVIPFAFDWGVCEAWTDSVFVVRRENRGPVPAIKQGLAWSVMGDLNSNCYRPEQDVVTCLQDQLKEQFQDLSRVKPSRLRTVLSNFKGRTMGQGAVVRQKLLCPRSFADIVDPALRGATELPTVWAALPPGLDYMSSLNNTVFCPLPRGVTGWATRTIDAVYAGCIPVLVGDRTHHPFFDMLDWTKFSITVDPDDLYRLEEILLSYTWTDVARLQTNLMLVRDAFIYPSDGKWDEHFTMKGPLYYALHSTALIRYTRFPRAHAGMSSEPDLSYSSPRARSM